MTTRSTGSSQRMGERRVEVVSRREDGCTLVEKKARRRTRLRDVLVEKKCIKHPRQRPFHGGTGTVLAIRTALRGASSLLLSALFFLNTCSSVSTAWEQPAHKEINRAATVRFRENAANAAKYRLSGVMLDQFVDAPVVTTTGKFSMTYNQQWMLDSVASHIVEGGFSADEPNVYVSMKHFYDPLALSGKSELTDQENAFGWVYEAIPATEWALYRQENPYCLSNAMRNYKKSMEIPSDASVAAIPITGDFRDFAGNPKNLAEMRSMYLGKAIRGIGEVMHLVADMCQPAHVRNDSHPGWEVTEQSLTGPAASVLVKFPRIDGLQGVNLGNQVQEIMMTLSTYTNQYFYSADSIADAPAGLLPENEEKPYASPNFLMFTTAQYLGYDTYYQQFGSRKIPMLKREPGALYGYNYEITPEFAVRQAEVLLPMAVAGTTRAMELFFPTFDMKLQVQPVAVEPAMLQKAKDAGAEDLKQFEAAVRLEHLVEKDPQWAAEGLRIEYSGPGELWRIRNGKHQKMADLEFVSGVAVSYQDPETGEQTAGNPVLYMPVGAEKAISMTGPNVDYTVEMDDSLYVAVTAGARSIRSNAHTFALEEPSIRIQADRTKLMPGEAVNFMAEIENPPERYTLEWTFGDEASESGQEAPAVRNRKTSMKHVYQKEGDYTATVRIVDLKRKVVRTSDSTAISSLLGEMAGNWNLVLSVQEENQFLRAMLVGLMKGLIQFIFSPLSQALGGEAIDPAAAEKFMMVGTQLSYSLDLRKVEGSETEYAGPLTYIGTTTSGIEGNSDIRSLRMEMRNGVIVFVAQAVNEDGVSMEFAFLKNGRMTSPGQMEGEFDFPGMMSGTWTAVQQ